MPTTEQLPKENPLKDKNLTDNFMFIKTFSDKEIFEKTVSLLLGEEIEIPNTNAVTYESTKKIDERVQFIKNSEEMQEEFAMTNLYENEIYADGKAEGKAEGQLSTLISLVQRGLLSVKNAAAEMNLTVEAFKEEMKNREPLPQS